jgi:hypothetical protein
LPARGRRRRGNPVFYEGELRLALAHDPARLEAALTEPGNVDLLTWNLFASLDTHRDPRYLAYRLEPFAGPALRAPVRISLWTGAHREPLLRPNPAWVAELRRRAERAGGGMGDLSGMLRPVEVPVRLESPDLVVLVDTLGRTSRAGHGGRDRLVELADAGLDQANRLSKSLAVAVVAGDTGPGAAELGRRLERLRDPAGLAAALPHRESVPAVVVRGVSWSELARVWEEELPYLDLSGQPVKAFARALRGWLG